MKNEQKYIIIYDIIEEIYVLEDYRRYSYGIAAYDHSITESTAYIIAAIRDISPNKAEIAKLVELCNRLKLSPIHLNDVVEDFLSK